MKTKLVNVVIDMGGHQDGDGIKLSNIIFKAPAESDALNRMTVDFDATTFSEGGGLLISNATKDLATDMAMAFIKNNVGLLNLISESYTLPHTEGIDLSESLSESWIDSLSLMSLEFEYHDNNYEVKFVTPNHINVYRRVKYVSEYCGELDEAFTKFLVEKGLLKENEPVRSLHHTE